MFRTKALLAVGVSAVAIIAALGLMSRSQPLAVSDPRPPTAPPLSRPSELSTSPSSVPPSSAATVIQRLQGRWFSGPVSMRDIKAIMVDIYGSPSAESGFTSTNVNAWSKEIGSPASLLFELEFAGDQFTEWWGTPGHPLEVGETGTFAQTTADGNSNYVVLTLPDGSGVDTYTLHVGGDFDHLGLHWVDSTEHGTAADKLKHQLYAVGFYCTARFTRAP